MAEGEAPARSEAKTGATATLTPETSGVSEAQNQREQQTLEQVRALRSRIDNLHQKVGEQSSDSPDAKRAQQELLQTLSETQQGLSAWEDVIPGTNDEELGQIEQEIGRLESRVAAIDQEMEKSTEAVRGQELRIDDRTDAQLTIDTLSPDGDTPACDMALSEAVTEARERLNIPEPTDEQYRAANEMLAAYILQTQQWSSEDRLRFEEQMKGKSQAEKDQEIIRRALEQNPNIDRDELFRKAALHNRVEELTGTVIKERQELLEKKTKGKNGERWKKIAASLGLTAGGVVLGTTLRHYIQQHMVGTAAGWVASWGLGTATTVASGLSGALAGGIVGGLVGALKGGWQGWRKGHETVYAGDRVVGEIETKIQQGELNTDQALALYEQLLRENKIVGNEQKAYENMRAIARIKAEEELRQSMEELQPIEGETEAEQQKRLAVAYTELLRRRVAPGGSEAERTEAIQQFIDEKRRQQRAESWKGARKEAWGQGWRSATTWATLGGVFGALFPTPAYATDINTYHLVHEAGNSSELANGLERAFSDGQITVSEMQNLSKLAGYEQLNVALRYELSDGRTVLDLVNDYAKEVKETQEYLHSQGLPLMSNENIHRGLHHVLSHPTAISNHWSEFTHLLRDWGGVQDGQLFTRAMMHGGNVTPWLGKPFAGGEYTNDLSESVRNYLAEGLNRPKLLTGGETAWLPFVAWFSLSNEARAVSKSGGSDGLWKRARNAWQKLRGKGGEESKKEAETSEEADGTEDDAEKERVERLKIEKLKPETRFIYVNPDIFKDRYDKRLKESEESERERIKQELERDIIGLANTLPSLHGHFFFLRDSSTGEIRTFRMYPLSTLKGNPNGLIPKPDENKSMNPYNKPLLDENYPVIDQIRQGKFQVREYETKSLFNSSADDQYRELAAVGPDVKTAVQLKNKYGKEFRETWDHDMWQAKYNEPKSMNWNEIFRGSGDKVTQLFVSPFEVDKYAYALYHGKADPGQRINLRSFSAETAPLNEEPERGDGQSPEPEKPEPKKEDPSSRETLHTLKITDQNDAKREVKLSEMPLGQLEGAKKRLEEKLKAAKKAEAEGKPVAGGTGAIEADLDAVNHWIGKRGGTKAETKEGTEPATEDKTETTEDPRARLPQSIEEVRTMLPSDIDRDSDDGQFLAQKLLEAAHTPGNYPFPADQIGLEWFQQKLREFGCTVVTSESTTFDGKKVIDVKVGPAGEKPQEAPAPESKPEPEVRRTETITTPGEKIEVTRLSREQALEIMEKVTLPDIKYHGQELTKEMLDERLLLPRYEINVDGKKIWTSSRKFRFSDRIAGLAYIEDGNTVRPLPYISSGSQGIFRFYPGFQIVGTPPNERIKWFDKGPGEESLALPISLQEALAKANIELDDRDRIDEGDAQLIIVGCYERDPDKPAMVKFPGDLHFGLDKTGQSLAGIEQKGFKESDTAPENIDLTNPEDKPDFNHKLSSWETEIPVYGKVTYDVFESRNHQYRYLFAREESRGTPRAWIAAIELTKSPVNKQGLRQNWIDAGVLTTPAFEYREQLFNANGKFYGNMTIRSGEYADDYVDAYTDFLGKIPIIQEYVASLKKEVEPQLAAAA